MRRAPVRTIAGRSARLDSLQSTRYARTLLGGSLHHLLSYFGLDDVANQAPRSFHKRKFVRQATFKQHPDAIVAGYIRRRHQRCVFCNAKMCQMDGLHENEEVLCCWVLYLGELPAKTLHKDVMKARADLCGLFADDLEALV